MCSFDTHNQVFKKLIAMGKENPEKKQKKTGF